MKKLIGLLILAAPSWGAVAFVQASSGGQQGTSTTAATGATSTTAHNTLVVFVANPLDCANVTTVTISDTAGNTYYQYASNNRNNNSCQRAYIARNIVANAANVITATFSVTGTFEYIAAAEFSGAALVTPRDMTTSQANAAAGTTVTCGPFSTFYGAEAIVLGASTESLVAAWTVSSGYTIPSGATSPDGILTIQYKITTVMETASTVTLTSDTSSRLTMQGISLGTVDPSSGGNSASAQ